MDQESDIFGPSEPKPGSRRWLFGWMGAICLVAVIMAVVLPPTPSDWDYNLGGRSRWARVQNDMRAIAVAIESYFADNGVYPAWAVGKNGINFEIGPEHPAYRVPTFMVKSQQADIHTLTTPVSYMSTYVLDPFMPSRRGVSTYGYWVGGKHNEGWILYSPGPDLKYDIIPWEDYAPGVRNERLINKTYDPTNGNHSAGDIYKIKN